MAKAFGRLDIEGFIIALGGINTVYSFMAVLAIFVVGNPRSGAGILVESLGMSAGEVVGCTLLSLGLAGLLAWHVGPFAARAFSLIDSRTLNSFALILTVLLSLVFAGPRGIIALATASWIGYFCLLTGTRRMSCMTSLILPALLFYVL